MHVICGQYLLEGIALYKHSQMFDIISIIIIMIIIIIIIGFSFRKLDWDLLPMIPHIWFTISRNIIFMGIWGFAIDCPCCVKYHRLTMCRCLGSNCRKYVSNDSWSVIVTCLRESILVSEYPLCITIRFLIKTLLRNNHDMDRLHSNRFILQPKCWTALRRAPLYHCMLWYYPWLQSLLSGIDDYWFM